MTVDMRGEKGRHVVCIELHDHNYMGKLEGLCGNWNGNGTDDRLIDGWGMGTDMEVGNNWIQWSLQKACK